MSAWLLAAALAGGAWAASPISRPAPDLPERGWLNARPLSLQMLRGRRAVVLAFLNTANPNSLRTAKVLQAWHERYGLEGLMVIGVHTPLYEFQRDPGVVRTAAKKAGLDFPFLLDNDKALWKAYGVEGWPALFLIDHKGRQVYELLGEGRYEEFEGLLRAALERVPRYARPSGPLAAEDPPDADCGHGTPELGVAGRPVLNLDKDEAVQSRVIGSGREGELSTRGPWRREADGLSLARHNPERTAFLRLVYQGTQAAAVLSPGAGGRNRVFVRQDGLWLHSNNAGPDIVFDDDGRSFVDLAEPRLYRLVRNTVDSAHELTLIPARRGATVHGFAFADRCLPLP